MTAVGHNLANRLKYKAMNNFSQEENHQPPWKRNHFRQEEVDPLAGFANIMDVMLVFALGLMLALISQSQELKQRFVIEKNNHNGISIEQGEELLDVPDDIKRVLENQGDSAMESLGTVYRDPKTGKLILIGQ